jgi:alkyldihydroxyacetonephosphate synthase
MHRRRKFWGWGWEDEQASPLEEQAVEGLIQGVLGMSLAPAKAPPRLEAIELRASRVAAPPALAPLLGDDRYERALHSYGKSYRDLVRALRGDFTNPPDLVAFPETEDDVARLLDWCSSARIAAIPYGGGSSVCGGVEPDVGADFAGTLSIDLRRMHKVLEIDRASLAARIQAGVFGPELEAQLRPHGLTLRHYPQSFEFSTLGGWIATRSGGHFATLFTHVDELVEALRVVTPSGTLATRRLPGDGAGPSPERLFVGSEGVLGIITEAWMRLFVRPRFRAAATALFADFGAGAGALKRLVQAGLNPENCRLLDAREAMLNGAGSGEHAVLLIGFESHDHAPDARLARALELCRDSGGDVPAHSIRHSDAGTGERAGSAGAWRGAFLRAPYLRDALVMRGVFVETFETAVTWDRFEALHAAVRAAALGAVRELCGATAEAVVTCRITHAYRDGAAPYFTVICPARAGAELEQWDRIKAAITDTMLEHGATVTHHHAVGRDLRPWYERQVPVAFRRALAAAKGALDPSGVLNPRVLLAKSATLAG